jgi:hypothetical protein
MMKTFKMDIHVHTCEVSACGEIEAAEGVRMYHEAGYQGIMITDHFHKLYFESLPEIKWEDKVDRYLEGYRKAKKEGERTGMQVLLGMEYRNCETDNDFLIVGLTEKFLYENPEIYELPLEEAIDLFHRNHMLVIQAHPVRFKIAGIKDGKVFCDYTTEEMLQILERCPDAEEIPFIEGVKALKKGEISRERMPIRLRVCNLMCEDKLDGIEVYNGNCNWAQDAQLIQQIIEKHPDYIQISASDFHERYHLARGGIVLNRKVSSSEELREALLDGCIIERIRNN